MIRHTSSSIFLWPDWVLPSLCVLIKIMTILGHILRPRWSQEEWLFVELCSRSLDESYIVRCWSKMIFFNSWSKMLAFKKTTWLIQKKVSDQNPGYLHVHLLFFRGTKYDPVIWQGTILNHYQCQCYCYQVFFWTLVWFQLQGFRSWQMLAWWVALRSLQKMLLPVPVCHALYKKHDLKTGTKMTWRLEQKWLENWNKNDLKTDFGVEKQRCRVDFWAVNFFGNFGKFRELENSWGSSGDVVTIWLQCWCLVEGPGSHQSLPNRTKWANHLLPLKRAYTIFNGFFLGVKIRST